MELPVFIERLPDGRGFTARLGSLWNLTAEAASLEAARQKVAELLQLRLQQGGEVRSIIIPMVADSGGGWLPDDELTQEWVKEMQRYRAECDEADRRRLLSDVPGGQAS